MKNRGRYMLLICILATGVGYSQSTEHSLLLRNGTYRLPENIAQFIASPGITQSEVVSGKYYRWIQFNEIPNDNAIRSLTAAGVELHHYIPNNTYAASILVSTNTETLRTFNIRSIIVPSFEYKCHEDIYNQSLPEWSIKSDTIAELTVFYYPGINSYQVKELLKLLNVEYVREDAYSGYIILRIDISRIKELVELPFVYYVEPVHAVPEPANHTGKNLTRSNMLLSPLPGGLKFDGKSMRASLGDDGGIGPHIDYQGKILRNVSFHGSGHSDHTAGTIFAAGNVDPRGQGMAPASELFIFNNGTTWEAVLSTDTTYAKQNVRVTSTSWRDGCNTGYNALAVSADQRTRNMPKLMHVIAAGNDGQKDCKFLPLWGNITGGISTAKNVTTVGNLMPNDTIEYTSGKGPAKDGRIKPDVCALGTNVYSTQSDNTYGLKTGTSMATPMMAGIYLQLMQAHKELNAGQEAETALLKALVMNTADELGNPGPDFIYGYGKVNAYRAFRAMKNKQYMKGSMSQGQSASQNISVPAGTKQLKIMLYWHDYEAVASAAVALVNNIDMVVTNPISTNYLPWTLDYSANVANLTKPAVRAVDNRNNIEQVTIDDPVAGNYTVNLNGTSIPKGPQDYYLVYEFISDDILLTYPNGGEQWVPGDREYIRWEAIDNNGEFEIYYSLNNGISWELDGKVPGNKRTYEFYVPNTMCRDALIKVQRNGKSGQSSACFSIMHQPRNLKLDWACSNSFKISWDSVPGVSKYEISMMDTLYMKVYDTTSNRFYLFDKNIVSANEYWVSVRAIGLKGEQGRRVVAVNKPAGTLNCPAAADASVVKIISPIKSSLPDCQSPGIVKVKILVENVGTAPISNIPVWYKVDALAQVNDTIKETLDPGERVQHLFATPCDLSVAGNHTISASAALNGDGKTSNDKKSVNLSTAAIIAGSFPFKEDFETFPLCSLSNCSTSCTTKNGWINEKNGSIDGIDWRGDDDGTETNTGPTVDHTKGTYAGKYVYLRSNSCTLQTAILLTPCIQLPAGPCMLSFWYHMYGINMGELHIDMIADGEFSEDITFPLSGNKGDTWRQATFDLTPYAGKKINLRFRGITGNGVKGHMALDDIEVFGTNSQIEFAGSNEILKLYPNPATDELWFTGLCSEQNLIISVIDIRGRELIKKLTVSTNGTLSGSINISDITPGIYFFQVKDGNKIRYHKFIKN